MKNLKEYIAPAISVLSINAEFTMLAASGPDTELKDENNNPIGGKPETGSGSGGGPGAKPYTPWEENEEW